jgi:hypothetical protein
MAKYHVFDNASFGHVSITEESDIKLVTYSRGQPFGMNGEILLMQERKQEEAKDVDKVRSQNKCCRGKTIRITYSECVFQALVIQHAKRLIVLSSVASPAVQHVSTLSH